MNKPELLTTTQEELIKHALGTTWGKKSYRNYFACGRSGDDFEQWKDMEAKGFARSRPEPFNDKDILFHVTEKGIEAVK